MSEEAPRRLRITIRVPAALAESEDAASPESQALQSMRQTRARSRAATSEPLVVPEEPERPPPSPSQQHTWQRFSRPQPTQRSPLRGILRNHGSNRGTRSRRGRRSGVHFEDEEEDEESQQENEGESDDEITNEIRRVNQELDNHSVQDIEDAVRGNTAMNPIYVDNMARMATMGHDDSDDPDISEFEDSDLEEPKDASEVLGEKISDPDWKDIAPALQVEIVENMFESGRTWNQTREALQLDEEEANLTLRFMMTRNSQINRENEALAQMRENQLQALMNIDNSDIRSSDVPHQLILRRTRETLSELTEHGNGPFPDLLLCQAADVLAGRQYLHRRNLPRSLAGFWDNRLVNLQTSGNSNDIQPERFEWNGNVEIESEVTNGGQQLQRLRTGRARPGRQPVPIEGMGSVNPGNLVASPDTAARQAQMVDWRRYYIDPTHAPRPNDPTAPRPSVRLGGLISLRVGSDHAARIYDSEELERVTGRRIPLRDLAPRRSLVIRAPVYTLADDTPTRATFSSSQLNYLDQLCTTVPPRYWQQNCIAQWNQAYLPDFPEPPPAPVKRSLGGRWSLRLARRDPAIGQRRFERQIEEARVEAEEARAEARAIRLREEIDLELQNAAAASELAAAAAATGDSPAFASLNTDMFTQEISDLPDMDDIFFTNPLSDDPLLSAINGRVSPYNEELDTTGQGFFTPEFIDALLLMHENRGCAPDPWEAIEALDDENNARGEEARDADGDTAMNENLSDLSDIDESFFDAMEM
ncbi:uncharacterized protein N7483_003534 [Penicillium malachiteum]|uniref:uncharacterized protein n=1 Tax=Penicillium malachiteum TaxID=1324776 RepID=UPI002547AC34|nr:uncharacterized protein N7483_003534 [Penicillium malachiteum]KAJ5729026.1 hypothetical protein N7483_003534 [Penicillium malachiteum]